MQKNYYFTEKGAVGFGITEEEARRDLYINLCRNDLSNDVTGEFKARREQLMPWQPLPNMLHISGIGCLIYEDYELRNTKNNKRIIISQYDKSIYYYMTYLFEDELSYTDIAVVIRPELDSLFNYISKDFVLIRDMPDIRTLGEQNGFEPYIIYKFDNGVQIGVDNGCIGIRLEGDELYHAIEIEDRIGYVHLLVYIACKMGILIDREGVYLYGEKN